MNKNFMLHEKLFGAARIIFRCYRKQDFQQRKTVFSVAENIYPGNMKNRKT